MNFYPFRNFFYAAAKAVSLCLPLPLIFRHTALSAVIARNNGYNARNNGYNARNNGYNARNNGYNARDNGCIARNNGDNACSGT